MSPAPHTFLLQIRSLTLRLCVACCLLAVSSAYALQTTDYTSEKNNRFSSGYPTNPVENASPNFVGAGLDWAGVGWNPSEATKSYGFVSPRHYLVARHFGGSAEVRIFANGSLQTYSQAVVEDTGLGVVFQNETLGDLSLGTLNSPIPAAAGLPRYAVLDLNSSSSTNTTSAYNNLALLLYGKGPNGSSSTRVGAAAINGVTVSGNNHYFTTNRTVTQLEVGDSGSPALHRWTNPAGVQEIAMIGNHAAINDTTNFINFTGTHQVMAALNNLMNDEGFALRVVGNPTNTWVGSSSTSINNRGAWGLNRPQSAPSDRFVNFNGSTAGNNRIVSVDTNHNLRGLYFLPTNLTNLGFTFQGTSTLTVGRGGLTNYDGSRQTFQAPLAFGAPQMWNGGPGGITAQNIANNGHLLEIATQGITHIDGILSGGGGLGLTDGTLELNGANTYTGTTYVNGGLLQVNGSTHASSNITVNNSGTLGGGGTVNGNVLLTANGSIAPGASVGTLMIGGALTFSSFGNGSGRFVFDLDAPNASDRIVINGTCAIGSGLLGLGDFVFTSLAGFQAGIYTLVSAGGITGSLDAADLTGTLAGFDVELQINGGDLQLVVTDPDSLTPYEAWAGDEPFHGDANGDGVPNGLSFLLGAPDPHSDAAGLLPGVAETNGDLILTFDMLKPENRGSATLAVQHSRDLGIDDPWTTVAVSDTNSAPTDGVGFVVVEGAGETNAIQATIQAAEAGGGGSLFARLRADDGLPP